MEHKNAIMEHKNAMMEHEDVQLLLQCDTLEALELIAENPKYYLNLIMNYTTSESGESIYLPYLLNVKCQREQGRLIIKFKLSPNSRWYEVGYTDGDDEQTYAAFTKKVEELIKYPPPERGHLIEQALGIEKMPEAPLESIEIPESIESIESIESPAMEEVKSSPADYITELNNCKTLLPEEQQEKYQTLLSLLTTTDPFVQKQLSLLPLATENQRLCVLHFLNDYIIHRQ